MIVRLSPVEEMIWSKAFIQERERFDGADVLHLLRETGPSLDWPRLLMRFGDYWRVLLSHLILFGFVYPDKRHNIPAWVTDELVRRLSVSRTNLTNDVCYGTLLSREQYLHDLERTKYRDGRARSRVDDRGADRDLDRRHRANESEDLRIRCRQSLDNPQILKSSNPQISDRPLLLPFENPRDGADEFFPHRPALPSRSSVTSRLCVTSFSKSDAIRAATVSSRTATLTSSLCSNDRLSTFVVPMTDQRSSTMSALTWVIPPPYSKIRTPALSSSPHMRRLARRTQR